jgi:hypothetical protein
MEETILYLIGHKKSGIEWGSKIFDRIFMLPEETQAFLGSILLFVAMLTMMALKAL